MKNSNRVMAVICALMFMLTGCSNSTSKTSAKPTEAPAETTEAASTRTVTDVLGREVEIPTKIDSIICTGPGALRLVCYAEAQNLVVGVEDIVNVSLNTLECPFVYVNHELFKDMPSIGKGASRGNTAYDEEIIMLQPDVILSAYSSDAIEDLAQKTGIPVVCITQYEGEFFGDHLEASLRLTGEILDKKERCEELISYMDAAEADFYNRTKDVANEDKLRAYTGAVTFGGGHGMEGTYANFGPFTAINAINVADETGEEKYFILDLEKLITWDPDVIFLDPANINLVNEQYSQNPDYFKALNAVSEGEVYSMPSYICYNTNIEMGIADTYYAGMVLFPEQFADIDIEAKTNEIQEMFVGKSLYAEMEEAGLGFSKITIGK